VTGGSVLTSLIIFTVLYGILAVIEIGLVVKYVKIGPPSEQEALASIRRGKPRSGGFGGDDEGTPADADEKPLAFAY
jgi:cytochrome d ubiquinol oxidase subunit I